MVLVITIQFIYWSQMHLHQSFFQILYMQYGYSRFYCTEKLLFKAQIKFHTNTVFFNLRHKRWQDLPGLTIWHFSIILIHKNGKSDKVWQSVTNVTWWRYLLCCWRPRPRWRPEGCRRWRRCRRRRWTSSQTSLPLVTFLDLTTKTLFFWFNWF